MYSRKTQLTLFLENKPGQFAEVCDLLFSRGVDILAMCATTESEYGVVRLVVDDLAAARVALEENAIRFLTSEVLLAEVVNRSGMAAGLGHRLAQSGLNIEFTYFSASEQGHKSRMVFGLPEHELDRAIELLGHPSSGYN
ncbi:MAG TPA: hypothetical protein PK668_22095 [Myxococcota bacterium]|nr:hypothetical protein [Myxococcota bacterium]HRY96332.1 hypothetical protein [Myxococcota bacterium]HSA21539.1 hypothetical protein [Myxococcota bacterium]